MPERKISLALKCKLYLLHEEGYSQSELGILYNLSVDLVGYYCYWIRKKIKLIEVQISESTTEEISSYRKIAEGLSDKKLSLQESNCGIPVYREKDFLLWYLAYHLGLLDKQESTNNSIVDMETKKKKKLSGKDIEDEKDRLIYYLQMENAFLKKK